MMKFAFHMGPSPLWDFDGLHLSASGSKALERRLSRKLKHSVNEIDMTDTKNAIDMQTDVTHQVIRFASSDNADVNALSSFFDVIVTAVSNDAWVQSNIVEVNFLLFPSHFCDRGEVSCGRKQVSPGHFPGRIPRNVADPSSSSVQ